MSYSKFSELSSYLLDCPTDYIFYANDCPAILPNIPSQIHSSNRLLYKWHSEGSYYPKRRNFLTFWFPVFRDKLIDNGTMFLAEGSHKEIFQYALYKGYNSKTFKQNNSLTQLEIPEYELNTFEKFPMLCKRGDIVVFKDNLVHSSSQNQHTVPSYATIIRSYDYSRDLTLSSNEGAGYLGLDDYGRPNMLPSKIK